MCLPSDVTSPQVGRRSVVLLWSLFFPTFGLVEPFVGGISRGGVDMMKIRINMTQNCSNFLDLAFAASVVCMYDLYALSIWRTYSRYLAVKQVQTRAEHF